MELYVFPIVSVVIGVVFTYITKQSKSNYTKIFLAFSGAFLLALTLFDLLPEVYHHLPQKQTGVLIMAGILFQIILEFFSKGAEHGHIHIKKNKQHFPWLLFISLCIHSFMEGFPIHHHNDMVLGVFIHKIPIAVLITSYLIQSGFATKTILLFLIGFSAMTPLGTLASQSMAINLHLLTQINAVVIGVFFHISTTILFESSQGHKFNLSKLIVIILGVVLAYFV